MTESPLDLLAIAPHPDDAELLCGGALAKSAALGRQVGILDLTRGETGTRGTPEIRAAEAQAAARVLRIAVRENAGLPDAGLHNTDEMRANWGMDKTWDPEEGSDASTDLYAKWKKAVTRTFDWVE